MRHVYGSRLFPTEKQSHTKYEGATKFFLSLELLLKTEKKNVLFSRFSRRGFCFFFVYFHLKECLFMHID